MSRNAKMFGVGMPCPRVIPHSDGSGTVDVVGDRVSPEWIGRRVWCYGAQSYRPFGTAAEYTVVPLKLVVQLPERVPLEGARLGIPQHSRSSRCSCRGFGRGAHRSRARRGGVGRGLRRSTSASSGSTSDRHVPLRERPRDRIAGRSRRSPPHQSKLWRNESAL